MVAGFPNFIRRLRRPPAICEALWVALLGGVLAVACVNSSSAAPPGDLPSVEISGVPHVMQRPDFCGEACVEMYLRKLHVPIDQNGVFEQSGLDPVLGRGCYTPELVLALQRIGFKTGPVWYPIPAADAWSSLPKA
jgi:hypothetical protein